MTLKKSKIYLKSDINLSKIFKASSGLNTAFTGYLNPTKHPVSFELLNIQGLSRLMVQVKVDCINILT